MRNYYLKKLQIKNYRNIQDSIIEFNPGLNLIFGENGNGKTNILESIFVLANKKSFRKNASFSQMISIDCEYPEIIIQSVISDLKERDHSYSCKIGQSGQIYSFDAKTSTRPPIPSGILLISPHDSNQFHSSAQHRREWFDHYIGQIDTDYKKLLGFYKKALKFKNALLVSQTHDIETQIDAVNQQLANYSFALCHKRKEFCALLNQFLDDHFKKLFSQKNELKLELKSELLNLIDESKVYDKMSTYSTTELRAGKSLFGSHKDDYMLLFDQYSVFDFCSLGQQKMSYFGLLFAYIELFRYKFNSSPIVLIDDVSGELDRTRWLNLIGHLEAGKSQVLITTANEKFKEEIEKIDGVNKLNVSSGVVTKF